ncbi:MAG: hypothetical protein AABW91_01430 [Nanoarchaeota archaeon]
MIEGGKGGDKTLTGLNFESRIRICPVCNGQIELAGFIKNKIKVLRCTCCGACYLNRKI